MYNKQSQIKKNIMFFIIAIILLTSLYFLRKNDLKQYENSRCQGYGMTTTCELQAKEAKKYHDIFGQFFTATKECIDDNYQVVNSQFCQEHFQEVKATTL